jgi:SAM-dependent methyltransferase
VVDDDEPGDDVDRYHLLEALVMSILPNNGIAYNPTARTTEFDWDLFWQFTSRHEKFNRLLYSYHFRHYRRLLENALPHSPSILELGAGTGALARRIIARWGGRATLIDSNEHAFRLFQRGSQAGEPIEYVRADVLSLKFSAVFDLVYSDGLIEHFPDKTRIMNAHLGAVKESGLIMFFVPNNSVVFKTVTRFGPDMGYEERYRLKALVELCEHFGLEVLRQTQYFFEVGVLCRKKRSH